MINDLFHDLPFDLEGAAPAFKPYSHRARKAKEWAKQNALPILGLALAVVI